MADNSFTQVAGSLQKYFDKRMMNLPYSEFDSVLANTETGIAGNVVIPGNNGQIAEFRYFTHFDPPTVSATNDAPKLFTSSAAPASGKTMSSTVVRMPLAEMVDFISLDPLLLKTDPIDLMQKAFDAFRIQGKRYVHRLVNQAFVNQISDTNSFLGDWAATKLPNPFPSIYAGGATDFDEVTETSYITMRELARAVAIFDNSPKNRFRWPDGTYKMCISHSVKNHWIDNDPKFNDFVKRHEDRANTALERNMLPVWKNVKILVQDDEYRCNLPSASGDPNTRVDAGIVQAAHFLCYGSFGYVDIAGKKRLVPKFKVQDITVTGNEITAGYRIPFQTSPIRNQLGLNIFGTAQYTEKIDDFAIAA